MEEERRELPVRKLVAWADIPDFGLYMDQVITYIERELTPVMDKGLTAAMINNYVKRGLIPRPTAKKYYRTQLALLLMIATLKRAVAIDDIAYMTKLTAAEEARDLYERFREAQEESMCAAAARLEQRGSGAMRCAIDAATYSMLCEAALREEREAGQ